MKEYEEALAKNHRWNFVVNILDASLFQVGFAFFIPAVILVAYLKHFTNNQVLLNLPVLISNFFLTLGPFVMSFFSARITAKKRMLVRTSLLQRLSFLPVVAAVFFGSQTTLAPFFVALVVFYLCWGVSSLFWQETIGRCFAPERLSSAMGVREGISRIVGFLASLLVFPLLGAAAFPLNFALLLGLAFVAWMLSYFAVAQLKEAPYATPAQPDTGSHWKHMLDLPGQDPAFRWYIAFIVCLYGFLFVGGAYTVVGLERFKAVATADSLTGTINTLTVFASALLVFFGGRISDRFGKFWGFLLFTCISLVLNVGMIFCTDFTAYLVLIFLSGVTYVFWVLELTTVLGFSTPERRHRYLAVISVVKLVPIVVYTNFGGWLANAVSYEAVFALAALFTLAALGILIFKLRPHLVQQSG
jgi:hypothetical protein